MSPDSQTGPTTSKVSVPEAGFRLDDRHDVMPRVIHRGANEVVHRRVEYEEAAPLARLDVDHRGDQQARVPGDEAARLDLDLAAQMPDGTLDHLPVVERQRRRLVGTHVRDAEPAAEIDPADVMARSPQFRHQIGDLRERRLERRQRRELAADVHVDANNVDPRQGGGARVGLDRARLDRHAELVLLPAGRDLLVRPARPRRGSRAA